jgi:hypothetical protein
MRLTARESALDDADRWGRNKMEWVLVVVLLGGPQPMLFVDREKGVFDTEELCEEAFADLRGGMVKEPIFRTPGVILAHDCVNIPKKPST